MPAPPFDPFAIARFSVIRVPYKFDGDPEPVPKLFVVLRHIEHERVWYALCLKTTSQMAFYNNNPAKKRGCVCYRAGEVPCFTKPETIIEPDNQFAIAHAAIVAAHGRGILEIHALPGDFLARLKTAIQNSVTLTKVKRDRLLGVLEAGN